MGRFLGIAALAAVLALAWFPRDARADIVVRIDKASQRVWASEDSREGPRAFRERRAPRFRGV